ncbi:hypothetical protein S245_001447, partial [Arachis hypogaea]
MKKDRHSKIHTSQELRDRRVRLSSEISRKFFDLQDMLEFNKPSNTLEWLFTIEAFKVKWKGGKEKLIFGRTLLFTILTCFMPSTIFNLFLPQKK